MMLKKFNETTTHVSSLLKCTAQPVIRQINMPSNAKEFFKLNVKSEVKINLLQHNGLNAEALLVAKIVDLSDLLSK